MARVTGIGGVFFISPDRKKSMQWYRERMGIDSESWGKVYLWREHERPEKTGYTVWSVFPHGADKFEPGGKSFMVNYRVDDIDGMIADMKANGVEVVGETEQHENGKFAWVLDPDGNKIELWQPVDSDEDPYL
ncbi:hypothetical protein ABI59_11730 [Acidobacteria bacterium Mor1]|nr:hypothetical protein ABI59_11730 [Acidobacteria bacterium Mor1]